MSLGWLLVGDKSRQERWRKTDRAGLVLTVDALDPGYGGKLGVGTCHISFLPTGHRMKDWRCTVCSLAQPRPRQADIQGTAGGAKPLQDRTACSSGSVPVVPQSCLIPPMLLPHNTGLLRVGDFCLFITVLPSVSCLLISTETNCGKDRSQCNTL